MKKIILFIVLFSLQSLAFAESPKVPREIEFADLRLILTEGARKEIQTHVNALYRSPKYFQIKLERVDLYFPIIERVLIEENLPEDFKYLVIQESSLISDAVSSSNAVGFWQFKKASGEEVGLRIDGTVDERLHIVASTRGAAIYLKRNNEYFDNWIHTLLSYNMGRTGAQRVVDKKYQGAKKMEINKRTHWYIIKFLAHKIAFEHVTGKNMSPELTLVEYRTGANKSLKQIADEVEIEDELLMDYNKWLKRGRVPDGKEYAVILPVAGVEREKLLSQNEIQQPNVVITRSRSSIPEYKNDNNDNYPIIEGNYTSGTGTSALVTVNGKPGIIAGSNVNLVALAEKGDVSMRRFLRYNDLENDDSVIPGQVYYLKSKRGKAKEHYHVAQPGETLWAISQKYGIKLKKLLRRNRMKTAEPLQAGRVLWMRFMRPRDEPVEYMELINNVVITASSKTTVEDPAIENKTPIPKGNTSREIHQDRNSAKDKSVNEIKKPDTFKEQEEQDTIKKQDHSKAEEHPEYTEEGFGEQEPVNFVEVPALNTNDQKMHIVKQGETLYGIARVYEINIGDLLIWNNIKLSDGLNIGQELYIADPSEGIIANNQVNSEEIPPSTQQEEFLYHEVKTGETMYKIAREYNVTIKKVMEWNEKNDFNVSVGDRLKIIKTRN